MSILDREENPGTQSPGYLPEITQPIITMRGKLKTFDSTIM